MAAHIGYLQGMRGDVSRLGSKDSGVRATAQGWHIGGQVYSGTTDKYDGGEEREYVVLSLNAGNRDGSAPSFSLRVCEEDTPKQIAKKLREAAAYLTRKPA
jgi:hypothetical protein